MRASFLRDGPRIPSLILFALFAVSLVGGMALVFQTISAERRERDQVELTTEVMTALRDSSRAVINAETGQRGFIITGDAEYLSPYLMGTRQWPDAQARLESLLAAKATPRQQELIAALRELGQEKLTELEQTVSLVEAGRTQDAIAIVRTDRGQETMVEYREAVRELEAIEREILDGASRDARTSESRVMPILIALAIVMLLALALGLWQVFRVARAEAEAATAHTLAEARDRADLLSRELNHRVKNLFAVIQAIVRMSLRGTADPEEAANRISDRINALSVAHSVTQGQLETPVADLEDLVRTAVAPYLTDSTRLEISGPQVEVLARQVTPLGMILHELVTNCIKYGAWSELGGELAIEWKLLEDSSRVELLWKESSNMPASSAGEAGFGTRMIDASIRQLDGTIDRSFDPSGLSARLEFARK